MHATLLPFLSRISDLALGVCVWWRGIVLLGALMLPIMPTATAAESADTPPAAVRTPGSRSLLAHWRFDESGGLVASEETGVHPGALSPTGAVFEDGGVAGRALHLSRAENGYVDLGSGLGLLDTSFSISAWVRIPIGEASPVGAIVARHRPGFGNGYGLLFNEVNVPDGALRVAAFVGDYGTSVEDLRVPLSSGPVNDGQWHHLVLVYELGGTIGLHVDGSPADAVALARPTMDSPANTLIGGLDFGEAKRGTFHGAVDELQIYNFALTDEEVDFLHRHPGAVLPTGLPPVLITPAGGSFTNEVRVTLRSGLPEAVLYFTLDGSEPTVASVRYTSPILLTTRATLRARAFVNGFPASDIESAMFEPDPGVRILPPGGTFTNAVEIQVTTRLAGVTLRHTLDGTEPNAASPEWVRPLRIVAATQVKVRAFLGDFPVSEVVTAEFQRVYAIDDGLPASWREQYFGPGYATDPRVAAEADPDNDGSSNLQEYLAGTDPLDPGSGFAVGIRAVPEVRFRSVPGQRYRILRRDVLKGETVVVVDDLVAEGAEVTHVDTLISAPSGFYLVERVN